MERFAVSIFPLAKPEEWREFCETAAHGERAEAHREFLRRLGITREHIFHQSTPAGDLMVLVHEGVTQSEVADKLGSMMQNPTSEHERYIATHVIPELHGVDPTAGPPPEAQHVASIDASVGGGTQMSTAIDHHAQADGSGRDVSPEDILHLGMGFWGSRALLSAVELGLFSELTASGPLAGQELRERLGLHERGARDFFDALVALGILDRIDGHYINTAATDRFLDRAKPTYVGGILEMAAARLYGFWESLTEGLRTGTPQNEIKSGGAFFDVVYSDPARLREFLKAMTGISAGDAQAIAASFPFSRYQTFIDIGCAEGCVPASVAHAHPHITGGGFDLPVVEPHFARYVESAGLADQLRFYPGDFFADPLPSADVLCMGHILHDWDIEGKHELLRKAYAALPAGGALIVYESIIDNDRRENAFGLLMSLNMLIETPAGFDYTAQDCETWMRDVGFRETSVHPLAGPDSMVVGIK
jgi:hypothetical protein